MCKRGAPGFDRNRNSCGRWRPGRVERLANSVPMRRGGSAVEVANTICRLVSEQASYINGALPDVSGGC